MTGNLMDHLSHIITYITLKSLKLGVPFVVSNYIYLSFVQIHALFYFNYIIYSGLLVFCCQYVARNLVTFQINQNGFLCQLKSKLEYHVQLNKLKANLVGYYIP